MGEPIATGVYRTFRHRTAVLGMIALGMFAGLIVAQLARALLVSNDTIDIGRVAPRDVRAPRQIAFVSEVETNRQRDLAQASIAPIFTPPDAQIARRQLAAARETLDRVAQIRAAATRDEIAAGAAISQLATLGVASMSPELAQAVLRVSDERWTQIDSSVVSLLDTTLRAPIQPDTVDSVKARLPSLISLRFTVEEAAIVSALAAPLVVPNTNFDAAATDAARRAARAAVRPVERALEPNQVIVRSGQVIGPADVEALDKLNLRQQAITPPVLLSAALWSALSTALFALALSRSQPGGARLLRLRRTALGAAMIVVAVLLGRWLLPGHGLLPYLAPFAVVAMCVASWSGVLSGIAAAALMGMLVGSALERPLEFLSVIACSGVAAALLLRKAERVSDFARAGLGASLTGVALVLAFHMPEFSTQDAPQIGLWMLASVGGNLAAAALAPVVLYLTGLAFDITTAVQLVELSRPSHPLLQDMLLRAPGTYHHSLTVASLAEQAAERISADSLLVRIGAYYHDIGKTLHPYFFIENQADGNNVHDQLDPATSSRVLQNHVADGLTLAKQQRLPTRIRDFIAEHHGTTVTKYQLNRARREGDEDVDESRFRYPGPRPRSKETAILMLADGCEAVVRARRPKSIDETDELIRKIITDRLADHQLDECPLTLSDLEDIRQSFLDTLRGMYHPRIEYPEPRALEPPGVKPALEAPVAVPQPMTVAEAFKLHENP